MKGIYIYDSVRTPGGKGNGSLAPVSPVQLLTTFDCLKEKKQFRHHFVEDLIVGCVTQVENKEECRESGCTVFELRRSPLCRFSKPLLCFGLGY
jgi:acetyl-CoA acetyltransferase